MPIPIHTRYAPTRTHTHVARHTHTCVLIHGPAPAFYPFGTYIASVYVWPLRIFHELENANKHSTNGWRCAWGYGAREGGMADAECGQLAQRHLAKYTKVFPFRQHVKWQLARPQSWPVIRFTFLRGLEASSRHPQSRACSYTLLLIFSLGILVPLSLQRFIAQAKATSCRRHR